MVGFITICGLFFLPLPSAAPGTGLNLSGASNCTVADFDAYVQFVNGPNDRYPTVIHKRNISSHPCVFDGTRKGHVGSS